MERLKNKQTILLFGILIIAAILRLYHIGAFMTFLGDEGRDTLVSWGILHGHFTLLGPRSSAADFFYGPIYYYFITPFLWLFHYNPVGPAVFIALLGIATVWLVYKVGKEFFGSTGALVAAFLYAIAPQIVIYSRSSWNPNPLPFFSLLSLYLTYKGVEKRLLKLLFIVGILLGIAIQLHYLALFLTVVIVLYVFIGFFINKIKDWLFLVKGYVLMLIGWIIGFSPFLAFEVRHGFPNTRTIIGFIFSSVSGTEKVASSQPFFIIVYQTIARLFLQIMVYFPENTSPWSHWQLSLWFIFAVIIGIASVIALLKMGNRLQMVLLLLWLVIGVIQFGFYKKDIFNYLLEFLFPLPFLLIGNLSNVLFHLKKLPVVSKAAAVIIVACFALITFFNNPMFMSANNQKGQAQKVAEFILSKTGGKPFNFALITIGDSDYAYRYFFQIEGNPPVTIQNKAVDPDRKTVTNQLFAVCEGLAECPNPLGDPLWEVAGFGRSEIAGKWDPIPNVIRVYKLKHYSGK